MRSVLVVLAPEAIELEMCQRLARCLFTKEALGLVKALDLATGLRAFARNRS
jgi:hypothetical protein